MTSLSEIIEEGSPFPEEACYPYTPGEHRLYAFVEAESEQEAKEMVHEAYRSNLRVTPADQVTPEQIKSFRGG